MFSRNICHLITSFHQIQVVGLAGTEAGPLKNVSVTSSQKKHVGEIKRLIAFISARSRDKFRLNYMLVYWKMHSKWF